MVISGTFPTAPLGTVLIIIIISMIIIIITCDFFVRNDLKRKFKRIASWIRTWKNRWRWVAKCPCWPRTDLCWTATPEAWNCVRSTSPACGWWWKRTFYAGERSGDRWCCCCDWSWYPRCLIRCTGPAGAGSCALLAPVGWRWRWCPAPFPSRPPILRRRGCSSSVVLVRSPQLSLPVQLTIDIVVWLLRWYIITESLCN